MSMADHYRRVISGTARGPLAGIERGTLRVAEALYGIGVDARNRAFDRGRREVVRLEVPVISVGNITVGGTGKTPTVIRLCRELLARSRKPAVLSRGYKARPGQQSDEMKVIARRVGDVICISHRDRVEAGVEAVRHHGADVLVLDDGFQHRRLARDLDIVLLDATCAFGYGHLLPRGLLRERVEALGRADVILVTRVDQVETGTADRIIKQVEAQFPDRPVVRCVHKPTGFVGLDGRVLEGVDPAAERVFLFAAIGNPGSFAHTAEEAGVRSVGCHWWPDHHDYNAVEVQALCRHAAEHHASLLLTTEKDAVKLVQLSVDWPCPVAALRIEIDFPDGGEEVVLKAIDRVLSNDSGSRRTV